MKFDEIKSGWSIIYIGGGGVTGYNLKKCISFSEDRFCLI